MAVLALPSSRDRTIPFTRYWPSRWPVPTSFDRLALSHSVQTSTRTQPLRSQVLPLPTRLLLPTRSWRSRAVRSIASLWLTSSSFPPMASLRSAPMTVVHRCIVAQLISNYNRGYPSPGAAASLHIRGLGVKIQFNLYESG